MINQLLFIIQFSCVGTVQLAGWWRRNNIWRWWWWFLSVDSICSVIQLQDTRPDILYCRGNHFDFFTIQSNLIRSIRISDPIWFTSILPNYIYEKWWILLEAHQTDSPLFLECYLALTGWRRAEGKVVSIINEATMGGDGGWVVMEEDG